MMVPTVSVGESDSDSQHDLQLPFVSLANHEKPSDSQPVEAAESNGCAERWDQMRLLALSLLDLCATYESELHTITAIQKSLERARRTDGCAIEAELLLGEISRQLRGLEQSRSEVAERLRSLDDQVSGVRRITY